MATITEPSIGQEQKGRNLVEMNWDPITRIVGSLGIFTKIDFDNRQVAECYSTSSIFRGYSIFMQGKDPRDAPFITSRICGICGDNHATCACLRQQYGFRDADRRSWANGSSTWAKPPNTCLTTTCIRTIWSGLISARQMVKQTNPGVLAKAKTTLRRMRQSTAIEPLPISCAR